MTTETLSAAIKIDVDAAFNQMVRAIAEKIPCHVLYLDDDSNQAKQIAKLFAGQPVRFHLAQNTQTAISILRAFPIDLVVVDINLGTRLATGEDWIFENKNELLAGKTVIVLSGHLGDIKEFERLKGTVERIVEKAQDEQREIWLLPKKLAHDRAVAIAGDVLGPKINASAASSRVAVPSPGMPIVAPGPANAGDQLGDVIGALFRRWIEQLSDRDKKSIYVGERVLSAHELLQEVASKTALGNLFLRVFAEDLGELL